MSEDERQEESEDEEDEDIDDNLEGYMNETDHPTQLGIVQYIYRKQGLKGLNKLITGKNGPQFHRIHIYVHQPDAIREFVRRGADLFVTNKHNQTPLALSIIEGQWETAEILMEAGGVRPGEYPAIMRELLLYKNMDFVYLSRGLINRVIRGGGLAGKAWSDIPRVWQVVLGDRQKMMIMCSPITIGRHMQQPWMNKDCLMNVYSFLPKH